MCLFVPVLTDKLIDYLADMEYDLGHYFTGEDLQGGLAWVGTVCIKPYNLGVSALNGNWQGVHTQSGSNWDLKVTAHEIGHILGAPHTHDYNPPIDECYDSSSQAVNSCQIGTLMSYCHLCPGGLNNVNMHYHARAIETIKTRTEQNCGPVGPEQPTAEPTVTNSVSNECQKYVQSSEGWWYKPCPETNGCYEERMCMADTFFPSDAKFPFCTQAQDCSADVDTVNCWQRQSCESTTPNPTSEPTSTPTQHPTANPAPDPTEAPPTPNPTSEPTSTPTQHPTENPATDPTEAPPTPNPTSVPSTAEPTPEYEPCEGSKFEQCVPHAPILAEQSNFSSGLPPLPLTLVSPLAVVESQPADPYMQYLSLDTNLFEQLQELSTGTQLRFNDFLSLGIIVDLRVHQVLADNAMVLVVGANGTQSELQRPTAVHLTGVAHGDLESMVFISLRSAGSTGFIRTGELRFSIEAAPEANQHSVLLQGTGAHSH